MWRNYENFNCYIACTDILNVRFFLRKTQKISSVSNYIKVREQILLFHA